MDIKDIVEAIKDAGAFEIVGLSTTNVLMRLGLSALMGVYIYFIYRITAKSGFYNRGFNKSLAVMSVVTTSIILAMQINVIVSLGMVGALSIVRFRNAVKDSMDLAYLFWSISMGIIIGTGMLELAVFVNICVTALILLLDLIPAFRAPCILVISSSRETDGEALLSGVKKHSRKVKVRSRNVSKRGIEWVIELWTREEAALTDAVLAVEGVVSANLLTHDGDIRF